MTRSLPQHEHGRAIRRDNFSSRYEPGSTVAANRTLVVWRRIGLYSRDLGVLEELFDERSDHGTSKTSARSGHFSPVAMGRAVRASHAETTPAIGRRILPSGRRDRLSKVLSWQWANKSGGKQHLHQAQ